MTLPTGVAAPTPSPSYTLAANRIWKQLTARERNVNTEALLKRHMYVSSKQVTWNLHNYLYRPENQLPFTARRFTGYLSRKRNLRNLLTRSICLEVIKLSTLILVKHVWWDTAITLERTFVTDPMYNITYSEFRKSPVYRHVGCS